MILSLAALASCSVITELPAGRQEAAAREIVDTATAPIALAVAGAGVSQPFGVAKGIADPRSDRRMTADTPVRIASNTKTFVAVTILKLHEGGRIDLDSAAEEYLDPELARILRADGYKPDRMTIRQLLSHSAGLYDQGSDPRFIPRVFAEPRHVWTRAELVRLATDYADPPAEPGVEYRYSDIGYILLGDIVERVTGKPLAAAVREAVGFKRLGMNSTWWELVEAPPRTSESRARQFVKGVDGTDIHPSYDLYGGGGLVMSARDLATFMAALFEGRVFDRPETLELMLRRGGHQGAELYRFGMQVKQTTAGEIYYHGGFWGTGVYYDPRLRRAVAGITTEQQAFRAQVAPMVDRLLGAAPLNGMCKASK